MKGLLEKHKKELSLSHYFTITSQINRTGKVLSRKIYIIKKDKSYEEVEKGKGMLLKVLSDYVKEYKDQEEILTTIDFFKIGDEEELKKLLKSTKINKQLFCCNEIKEFKPIRTEKDDIFKMILNKIGSNDKSIVYSVKKQINFGKTIHVKYYNLFDHIEIEKPKELYKANSYKNYMCKDCNYFYSIDLFSKSKVYNKHHFRGIINF